MEKTTNPSKRKMMIQVIYDEKSFHLKRKLKFLSFAFIVCNIDVIFSIFRYNNKYNFVHLFFF